MSKKVVYVCDCCKKEVSYDESLALKITVDTDEEESISISKFPRRVDICSSCLKSLGFIFFERGKNTNEMKKQNDEILMDNIFNLLKLAGKIE